MRWITFTSIAHIDLTIFAVTYIDENRERVSSESAYLTKDVLSRPNLSVAIHAHVTRILFDKVDGETRAVGVEYAKKETGPRYRSRARKEVILSYVVAPVIYMSWIDALLQCWCRSFTSCRLVIP